MSKETNRDVGHPSGMGHRQGGFRSQSRRPTLTSLHRFAVLGHVVRSDGLQEPDVVVAVVLGHVVVVGFVWPLGTERV